MGRLAQRQLKHVLDAYPSREVKAAMEVRSDEQQTDAMDNSVCRYRTSHPA